MRRYPHCMSWRVRDQLLQETGGRKGMGDDLLTIDLLAGANLRQKLGDRLVSSTPRIWIARGLAWSIPRSSRRRGRIIARQHFLKITQGKFTARTPQST